MPIFSNRSIERMLTALKPVLDDEKLNEFYSSLAKIDDAIAAEWEICILYCLSRSGHIEIPEAVDGVGRIDAIFTEKSTGDRVIIEITTLSDRGRHDKNPVPQFRRELHRVGSELSKRVRGAFNYRFGHIERNGELILGIPDRAGIAAFFKSEQFSDFLARIKQHPTDKHRFDFVCRGSSSAIEFNPNAAYSNGGHISYDVILDLRKNAVVNRLKKKNEQIKRSKLQLPSVVFVCDGDSRALRTEMNGPGRPTLGDVIHTFINGRQHQAIGGFTLQTGVTRASRRINAVIALAVKEKLGWLNTGGQRKYVDTKYAMAQGNVSYPIKEALLDHVLQAV